MTSTTEKIIIEFVRDTIAYRVVQDDFHRHLEWKTNGRWEIDQSLDKLSTAAVLDDEQQDLRHMVDSRYNQVSKHVLVSLRHVMDEMAVYLS